MKRWLSSAFAAALLSSTGAAHALDVGGLVAADGRAFVLGPKYVGQSQGTGVSLVAEPEFSLKTEDEAHLAKLHPFYRLDPIDERRSHPDLREGFYRLKLQHWEMGLGVGQFTWGVLESHRPSDVMNQVDFVESIYENAKLGQPYAEVGWLGDNASLKLYYLPYFRERTFPGLRGRVRFPAIIDTDTPIFEPKLAQWYPSGAARFSLNAGKLDFGVGLLSGLSREPRFVVDLTSGAVLPRYDTMQHGSMDVQWTLGPVTLKAEGFARLWTESFRAFGGGGIGVDWTLFQIVGDADLTFAAEGFADTRPSDAPITFYKHAAFGGFRFAFNDTASTEITGGAAVDVLDGTTFSRLEASRRFGEHWRVGLDANAFFGPTGSLYGAFARDHHGHARVAYHF